MRTRGGARPGGDTHAPFYAGGTTGRFSGSRMQAFCRHRQGEYLTLLLRGQRRTTKRARANGAARGRDRAEKLTQKAETPAVGSGGLSCRGFTTILADRDVGT